MAPAFSFLSGSLGFLLLLVAAIAASGSFVRFLDGPAILLVLGGTLSVTVAGIPPADLRSLPSGLRQAFAGPGERDGLRLVHELIEIAAKVRGQGLAGIERDLPRMRRRPILHDGLLAAVEGQSADRLRPLLVDKLAAARRRLEGAAAILARAAEVAPAMGLLGTLVGLVRMLAELDDPSAIGPGLAVALLTTLYGLVLAHVVCTPLHHLVVAARETLELEGRLEAVAVLSIAEAENPRFLATRLQVMAGAQPVLADGP